MSPSLRLIKSLSIPSYRSHLPVSNRSLLIHVNTTSNVYRSSQLSFIIQPRYHSTSNRKSIFPENSAQVNTRQVLLGGGWRVGLSVALATVAGMAAVWISDPNMLCEADLNHARSVGSSLTGTDNDDIQLPKVIKEESGQSLGDSIESDIDTVPDVMTTQPNSLLLLSEICNLLRDDWLLVLGIVGVTGVAASINIITPVLIGELVTAIQGLTTTSTADSIDLTLLNVPALKLLGLFICQGLLTFIDITLVTNLGEIIATKMKRQLYSSILQQDISFFDSHMQGEVVGRLTQDVGEFKHTFKLVITQGLKCCVQVIGSAIHLFRISSQLTFTLLSSMPLLYFAMNLYGMYLRQLSKAARFGDSVASGVAGEAVSNIRTVRAFASEDRELDHYIDAVSDASKLNCQLGFNIGLFQGLTNTSIGSMVLLILFYGGSLVAKGDMTGGQLMTYMVSTQNAQRSLAQVGVLFGQVIKALGSAARVFEYIHLKPTIPLNDGISPHSIQGDIEFQNISFSYPTRPDQMILERFNLRIPVGKVIALCGPSGSGKSTIGQLIERFYDPKDGLILIDGYKIKDLDPSWLRKNIGYINQEPILFATSIYENIRYGHPHATREEVEYAALQANASDFINAFPNGYDTVVGERGVALSGGQKQRIAIARALLKNPKVLILDEATSALDNQSERLVQDALEKLMKGRTVLVIAHRLSTIQSADMIVVMSASGKELRSDGNIIEKGTHDELMRKQGAYYRLYQQMAGGV